MKTCFTIFQWMTRLDLDVCGMIMFAVIRGLSSDVDDYKTISTEYFAEVTGYAEEAVMSSIHNLKIERLISIRDSDSEGCFEYAITEKAVRLEKLYRDIDSGCTITEDEPETVT